MKWSGPTVGHCKYKVGFISMPQTPLNCSVDTYSTVYLSGSLPPHANIPIPIASKRSGKTIFDSPPFCMYFPLIFKFLPNTLRILLWSEIHEVSLYFIQDEQLLPFKQQC